jgi:hypothetical protein
MKKILVLSSAVVGAASLAALAYKNRKALSELLHIKDTYPFAERDPDVTPISFANESTRFGGLE